MRFRGRPSPALVVAVLALFVAASGGAWAAGGVPGTGDGTSMAQKKKKKKKAKAKRGPRGKRGLKGPSGGNGAQGPRGAAGFQGARGAQGPQGPIGPSAAFNRRQAGPLSIAAAIEPAVIGTNLSVPTGSYVVNVSMDLAGNQAGQIVSCDLRLNNNPLAEGTVRTSGAVFGHMMTLTGATTNGGNLRVACAVDVGSAQARTISMTAIRVGSLTTP